MNYQEIKKLKEGDVLTGKAGNYLMTHKLSSLYSEGRDLEVLNLSNDEDEYLDVKELSKLKVITYTEYLKRNTWMVNWNDGKDPTRFFATRKAAVDFINKTVKKDHVDGTIILIQLTGVSQVSKFTKGKASFKKIN